MALDTTQHMHRNLRAEHNAAWLCSRCPLLASTAALLSPPQLSLDATVQSPAKPLNCGGQCLTCLPCRLEINGLASVAEAQRIATDFWQLHAPAGAPLGARDIMRSRSPARGAAARRRGGAGSDSEDCGEGTLSLESPGSGADTGGVAPMDTDSGRRLGDAATAPPAAVVGASGVPASDDSGGASGGCSSSGGGGGRWRIEWRRPNGARVAAQYVPPPGAHLRLMLLSVADGARAWQ